MVMASRAAAVLALCGVSLGAQTEAPEANIRTHSYSPPSTILRAEINLVQTGLTVRDSNSHTVGGLHASDFELLDNGVSRQITGFSELRSTAQPAATAATQVADTVPAVKSDPAEPRYITFFFDDIDSIDRDGPVTKVPAGISYLKKAAHAFIDKGIRSTDRLSIATASGEGGLDFTDDAKLFVSRFDALRSRAYAASAAQSQMRTLDMIAALGAAAMRLSEMHGTRILLLISHGFSNRIGRTELDQVLDTALRWSITVQAIYARGLDVTPSELWSPAAFDNARWSNGLRLQELAERTGGHFFKDTNDFAGAMEAAVYPEVTYLAAFQPGDPDGKFHTLKIRLKSNPGDSLEYRQSYFSRKDDESEKKLAARAPMDDAVFSNQTLQDVPAAVTLTGGKPRDGVIPVSIGITLDVNRLQFTTSHGRHMQQIVFLMTLLDARGGFVTGKESIMDIALTDAKLASLKKDGLRVAATLEAPAGIYQVRTVVREGMKGGLAASTTAVELRAK